jgi:hypothetical protein
MAVKKVATKTAGISREVYDLAKKRKHFKENPVEFIENFVKIPTPGGSELLKLYDPQKRIIKNFFQFHEMILLKSRQIGMSTLTQAIITYIFTFYENCVVGVLSRDSNESSDFCRKTQDMIDQLPDWLRPVYKNKSIQYFILENGCQLHIAAVSPANPGAVFRSKSITLLIIDEAAHIRDIDQAWTGIGSTLSKVQQVAQKKGIPYGTIILSTPNKTEGIGKWYFQMWIGALAKTNAFRPHKIHWTEIPDFKNDPGWYKKQCKILNGDKNRIAQELELKFVGSGNSLFTEDVQTALQDCAKPATEVVQLPNYKGKGELWRFKNINRGHFHIIGVDAATAAGIDRSAIEVIEYETMEQVMEFNGHIDPKELSDVIRLICAHCPHNIIVVENQGGYGQAVLYELMYDEEVVYNLYGTYKGKDRRIGTSRSRGGSNIEFIPGLSTNTKTRPLILDALYDVVAHDPDVIYSERLAAELLGLTNKGSKVEADKGFHDDLALAYGFCCYVRKYEVEALGDVEGLREDEVGMTFTKDTIEIMRGLNGEAPFSADRQVAVTTGVENPNLKSDMNKYIQREMLSGNLCGYVDVLAMFGDMPFGSDSDSMF